MMKVWQAIRRLATLVSPRRSSRETPNPKSDELKSRADKTEEDNSVTRVGETKEDGTDEAKPKQDPANAGKPVEDKQDETKEPGPSPGSRSEFKRVDEVYDNEESKWVFRDSGQGSGEDESDKYRDYCFTLNRKFKLGSTDFSTTIHIKSPHLKKVGKAVMGSVPGVSWNPAVVQLEPEELLAWLPSLRNHLNILKEKEVRASDDTTTVEHLSILLDFLTTEYASTLERINGLVPHGEITFELLWSVMLSRTLLYTVCPITRQPRVVELVGAELVEPSRGSDYWELECRYIDSCGLASPSAPKFGHSTMYVDIPIFKGAVKIVSLSAYPLKFHTRENDLRAKLIERGRRWMQLEGTHHMAYDGTSFWKFPHRTWRQTIAGRIMIDKVTFKHINASYHVQAVEGSRDSDNDYIFGRKDDIDDDRPVDREEILLVNELTEDQMLLTTPILYGFSLADNLWQEFNVDSVKPIVWDDDAFSNLVLPPEQKELIQSLVEAHSRKAKFDDFVKGKGQGLIFNLYGPPGIGKTMTAEATSEHVRRPLYVVTPSDLGTQAENLDPALTEVFEIAQTWGAVVLLDEADVYMEDREGSGVSQNALVAVFLRQLEYFRGILFLTTNRVKTFDEAFHSRIHVSLRFKELDRTARRQIWKAFFVKVGLRDDDFTEYQWETLALKKINGRQIKNCVRTAQALAEGKSEQLAYSHLDRVLTVMDQFEQDFRDPVRGEAHLYS